MAAPPNNLASDEALLVFGSQNSNIEDRSLPRDEIRPVQVIVAETVIPVPYFDSWGEFGVSSMALVAGAEPLIYITTGPDLFELQLGGPVRVTRHDIPRLQDVHELSLVDGVLWLANTGYDEAVGFDVQERRVARRIKLDHFRLRRSVTEREASEAAEKFEEIDRFHCNQLFEGMSGELYALVHHVSGRQLITRITKKLIKKQGGGGVIDLDSGRGIWLGLKAPHTVRVVDGEYWVFDSGNMTINVYDCSWRLNRRLPTFGWGRGGDLSRDMGFYYAGISEKRRRYRDSGESAGGNLVQVFRTSDGSCAGEIPLRSGIEQINNVYVVSRDFADTLLAAK